MFSSPRQIFDQRRILPSCRISYHDGKCGEQGVAQAHQHASLRQEHIIIAGILVSSLVTRGFAAKRGLGVGLGVAGKTQDAQRCRN